MKQQINNNSGIDNVKFKFSYLGKYVETNLGNKGIIVEEYLCYPEPSEWVLDNGYILNEALMHEENEEFVVIKSLKELENTIKRLEKEVNKQAEIIQWYEKENRHNQEIIIDLSKRIDKTTQAIDELLSYDDFKDITNASFGNVKEELKFYLSNYKTLKEFRKANLKEND